MAMVFFSDYLSEHEWTPYYGMSCGGSSDGGK